MKQVYTKLTIDFNLGLDRQGKLLSVRSVKLFLVLTRSSTRLMLESGGPMWRLRFFWWTVHGSRRAKLANVSPYKEEKISLVRQACNDGELWPVVFPSGIHPSPFCSCGDRMLHRLKHSADSIRTLGCPLLPDDCINPWSFFSSFYSCIECFPQRVASSPNSCLFHPPPCLQHSDEHLSHLLQKVNTVRKCQIIYTSFVKKTDCFLFVSPELLKTPASSWLHIPSEQAISEPSRDPVSLPSILEE